MVLDKFSQQPNLIPSSSTSRDTIISPIAKNRPNSTFQPIPIKPQRLLNTSSSADDSAISSAPNTSKQQKDELNNKLGRLDGLISNPLSKTNKVRVPDSKKIAAILLETNIVELQRHLLTITVQNQVSCRSLCDWLKKNASDWHARVIFELENNATGCTRLELRKKMFNFEVKIDSSSLFYRHRVNF